MSMTISIDDALKTDFSSVCRDIGISPSTAFTIFARTVVRERQIPFVLRAETEEQRQARMREQELHESIAAGLKEVEQGRVCSRSTIEEMRARRNGELR